MEDKHAYLPYFIDETIYVIASSQQQEADAPEQAIAEAPEHAPAPTTSAETSPIDLNPIVTFGENLKHCIVLFSSSTKISPESKDLLFKILGAINRTPKDALMANVHGCSSEQLQALLAEHNHRHLISFGITNIPQLSEAQPYQPITEKGKYYILSDHLEAVAVDLDKKKALWKALKNIFH
jgi:hypothetical protein